MEFYSQPGQSAKQYVRVHKDGNQEEPATFAVTLDEKELYTDKENQSATVGKLSAAGHEPRNAHDHRSDDIATPEAQVTQVLHVLPAQQVNNQQVRATTTPW